MPCPLLQLWSTKGGTFDNPITAYTIVPPPGYVALGVYFIQANLPPGPGSLTEDAALAFALAAVSPLRCVREDLVLRSTLFENYRDQGACTTARMQSPSFWRGGGAASPLARCAQAQGAAAHCLPLRRATCSVYSIALSWSVILWS